MPNPQGPSKLGNKDSKSKAPNRSPETSGYDKKLDGPNRPST